MTASPDSRPLPSGSPAEGPSSRRLAYRTAAWAFGVILVLSTALLVWSLFTYLTTVQRRSLLAEADASSLVLVISIATSLVSLIGLLSTNLLAWRREAREARTAEVQLQRQQLEIEKLKLELEKQKREE
jgi:hypothetical protein